DRRRPRRTRRGSHGRARRRRPGARSGSARADVLRRNEAPALAGSRDARPPPRAAPRRAVRRARSAREEVARGPVGGDEGRGRRAADGDAFVRARARHRRSPGRARRRAHRARHRARHARSGRRAAALRGARRGIRMSYARRALAVAWKDLAVERRSKETLNALVFFSLLLLFVFLFTLGGDRERLAAVLPGVLWLGFVLSALLALGRTFLV